MRRACSGFKSFGTNGTAIEDRARRAVKRRRPGPGRRRLTDYAAAYRGGLTTTYWTVVPEYWGAYQVLPHCE